MPESFFLLSLTRSNILIGRHKCFMNTFYVSWVLFTNKLNSSHYVQISKIFGTVKKWLVVALDRWSFCAMLIVSNITWVVLWVVVMERWLFYRGGLWDRFDCIQYYSKDFWLYMNISNAMYNLTWTPWVNILPMWNNEISFINRLDCTFYKFHCNIDIQGR